ncbi:MAG: glutamate 5-kinase [Spirochaetes bacterium]|jgi:glutamate 5-kinase|nr:glutamate 5-kinase [Spirochaetota bacterium]
MPRKNLLKHVKKIVVKIGTSSITEKDGISIKKISGFVDDVDRLIKKGYRLVIVTSGAIATGATTLGRKRDSITIPEKQALASVGQVILINEYRKHFDKKGIKVGQILLTEDDVKNRKRFVNARHTLDTLMEMGVIPIVNENDSVAVEEIKFGDNDTLSAHVACLIDADLLILLSDIDGFFREMDDPEPVEEIYEITEDVVKRAGGSGSSHGTGGMFTKIKAADIIIRFGEMMVIANSGVKNVLGRIMNGDKIGTIFVGKNKQLKGKKRWISMRNPRGLLVLDAGAVEALRIKKKSLLASGIKSAAGHFEMGDVVELSDESGNKFGKGSINYNRSELELIKGKRTGEIKGILGSKYFDEVVNRNDLVLY